MQESGKRATHATSDSYCPTVRRVDASTIARVAMYKPPPHLFYVAELTAISYYVWFGLETCPGAV